MSHEDPNEGTTGVDGVLFVFFSLLVGLMVRVVWAESYVLKHYMPLPYTVVIFVIGLGWGYCTPKYGDGGDLDTAMTDVVGINPHLFLQVFIPALLFESGFAMNMHTMRRVIWQCLWLAGVGVIISMAATAFLSYYLYPQLGGNSWSWNTSFMYGAMVAATDPVAVAAVMKELGAPEMLATVIEGESLLNDGTSYVLFSLFRKRAEESQDAADTVSMLLRMSLGSAAFGALMGFATAMLLKVNYHRDDLFFELMATLTFPYITFWVAENPLECSGVLATVIMALVTNQQGRFYIRHGHSLHQFWEHLAFIANTLVFMISGAIVGDNFDKIGVSKVGPKIANYVILNLIRAAIVFGSIPLMRCNPYGFDKGKAAVATWGGLRGAVGLAMAIMVLHDTNIEYDHRKEIFDYTASLVLFTLCINGTSCGFLMKYLHYDRQTKVSLDTAKEAREQLISIGRDWIDNQSSEEAENKTLQKSEWEIVASNLTKLDDHSRQVFEGPVRQTTLSETEQVREQILHSFKANAAAAAANGVLDTSVSYYLKYSCDTLLDPLVTSLGYSPEECSSMELSQWWCRLLEPEADRLLGANSFEAVSIWDRIAYLGRWCKAAHLRTTLKSIEIALGFQAVVAQVAISVTERREGASRERQDTTLRRSTRSNSFCHSAESDTSTIQTAETKLVLQLESAAADAQAWLEKQSAARVGMVETRRAIKHFLLKMAEEAHEFERSGRFTAVETNGFLRKIKYLQAKNHFIYGSRKFQATFATANHEEGIVMNRGTQGNGVELETHATTATPVTVPSMGQTSAECAVPSL